MKNRYRMFRRGHVYYAQDSETGKQLSLKTTDKNEAQRLIGNRFSALRDICPEFEAGSLDFHARMLPDGALRVKCPAFRGAGRASHHEMPGPAGGRAGNASLQGAPCRCRGSQFSANTGSWS